MKTTRILLAAVISVGLAFGVTAQATEEKGEAVDMNSLPAAVQKTIKEKAEGGEIVRVEKEKEGGKWVYEATVKKGSKEWEFKVDSKGKYWKSDDEKSEKGEKY